MVGVEASYVPKTLTLMHTCTHTHTQAVAMQCGLLRMGLRVSEINSLLKELTNHCVLS